MYLNKKNAIVVGSGVAGIFSAYILAKNKYNVTIYTTNNNEIGGTAYDYFEGEEYIQKYGPHIFNTNNITLWKFLHRFGKWIHFRHKVKAEVDGRFYTLPINLNTIDEIFQKKDAMRIRKKLLQMFGFGSKVPITKLAKSRDSDLRRLAEWAMENIYIPYSKKQWGIYMNDVFEKVTKRVPIKISTDDSYLDARYQGIPADGYSNIFRRILRNASKNANVQIVTISFKENKKILEFNGDAKRIKIFDQAVSNTVIINTSPIDDFLGNMFGELPYIPVEFRIKPVKESQMLPVINTPSSRYKYTRRTQASIFFNKSPKYTLFEIPNSSHNAVKKVYPVPTKESQKIAIKYLEYIKTINKLTEKHRGVKIISIGRLGQYKYINMSTTMEYVMHVLSKHGFRISL